MEGACFTINPESDTLIEGTETLSVSITPQNALAAVVEGRGMAVVSIEDDEGNKECVTVYERVSSVYTQLN